MASVPEPDLDVSPPEQSTSTPGSQSRSNRGNGEFVCDQCHTTYARAEHLARHKMAHTGQKKYKCVPCNKSFSRSDVFKRHNKLHERDSNDPGAPLQSTRKQAALQRSVKACRLCASLKVKCDGGFPCLRCASVDRDCIYTESTKRHRSLSSSEPPPPQVPASLPTITIEPTMTLPPVTETTSPPIPQLQDVTMSESAGSLPDLTLPDLSGTVPDNLFLPGGFGEAFDLPFDALMPSWEDFRVEQFPNDILGGSELGFDFLGQDYSQPYSRPDASTSNTLLSDFQEPSLNLTDVPLYEMLNRLVSQQMSSVDEAKPIYVNVNGPSTRQASPAPDVGGTEEVEDWPLSWNPRGTDSALNLGEFADASSHAILRDHTSIVPPFDQKSLLSVLETLRFAGLSNTEYHGIYKTLSNIQLQTYDLFIQLFWQHFQKTLPFLHRPTFRPKSTVGFLLISMISIGAFYSRLDGAHHLGRILFEVTRRGVEQIVSSDNRLSRSLPLVQSMLIWSCSKWTGSPRFMELAEVFHSVYLTCLRRLRVFDPVGAPVLPESATLHQRWYAWITWEERRRTGMACFALEAETSALLQLPQTVVASELRLQLPSSEDLWTAPTAEAWELLYTVSKRSSPSIISTIHSLGSSEGLPLPNLTPFASLVMFKALQSMTFSLFQLRACNIDNRAAVEGMLASLLRLSQGRHEFCPIMGRSEAEWSGPLVAYHLANCSTRVNFEDLQSIAGRGTKREVVDVKEKLELWMTNNSAEARTIAIHAAQVIRVIRNYPTDAPYEPMSLFFAAILLYMYCRSQMSDDTTAFAEAPPFPLDGKLDEDPSLWVVCGGPSALHGVGNLKSPLAPKKILQLFGQVLSQRLGQVWEIGSVLGNVINAMEARE